MADITPTLIGLLRKHDARIHQNRPFGERILDEFLREAYRINSHLTSLRAYLKSIRQPYLSISHAPQRQREASLRNHARVDRSASANAGRTYFTDAQRDQIDNEAKLTLRDLNAGIRQLEEVERMRVNTYQQLSRKKYQRGALGALSSWAAGGTNKITARTPEEALEEAKQQSLSAHRGNVIWYLRRGLEEAAELQRAMMETRIEREVERSKGALYKTNLPRGMSASSISAETSSLVDATQKSPDGLKGSHAQSPTAMDEKDLSTSASMSPEQLQMLEQENNDLLKHYEDTLDQVRAAEHSMLEISELQSTLAQNLEIQSSRIDQLVEDSTSTEQNISGGNKQLKKASERWRPARIVFYASCGLCVFLIGWDLVV